MNIIFSYRRKLVVILIFVFECTIQKYTESKDQSKAISHTNRRYSHKQNGNPERIKNAG